MNSTFHENHTGQDQHILTFSSRNARILSHFYLSDDHTAIPYNQTASKTGQYLGHVYGMFQSVDLVIWSDLRNADRLVASDNNSFGKNVELVGLEVSRAARARHEPLVRLMDVIISQRQLWRGENNKKRSN